MPVGDQGGADAATGATVLIKHENTQPTGAFKVRGGITLLAGLDPAERTVECSGTRLAITRTRPMVTMSQSSPLARRKWRWNRPSTVKPRER